MSKEKSAQKQNDKKKPQKTLKEKRRAKREKPTAPPVGAGTNSRS
jgi:hypothetical protein